MTFPTEWKVIKFHGSSHHQPDSIHISTYYPIIKPYKPFPSHHHKYIGGWKKPFPVIAGLMGSNDLPVMGFFKKIFLLDMAINMGVLLNLGYATTINPPISLKFHGPISYETAEKLSIR